MIDAALPVKNERRRRARKEGGLLSYLEYPEIMTQGETLKELEENMRDAYILMTMEDVQDDYEIILSPTSQFLGYIDHG
ncbi:MAG TPA: hypothetical protein DCW46_09305 [Desulfotomaculum sp.]|nr:hypothetical protein [Desulfotomaculum sp.]